MRKHSITVWSDVNNDNQQIITDINSQKNIKYSYQNKHDEHLSSNPGELMAAAHAGSFSMKLNALLNEVGYFPKKLETTCDVVLNNGIVTKSALTISARIQDINNEVFQEIAYRTLQTCPISNALNVKIKLKATLEHNGVLSHRLVDSEYA